MAEKLSFSPTLRASLPWSRFLHFEYCHTQPFGIVHSFTLIATAIRFRAFLGWKKNPAFSSHKTILE